MERKRFDVNYFNIIFIRRIYKIKYLLYLYLKYFRLQKSLQTLPGDTLMVSAFVSYVGYFTKIYRQELIQNAWLPFFKEVKVNLSYIYIYINKSKYVFFYTTKCIVLKFNFSA